MAKNIFKILVPALVFLPSLVLAQSLLLKVPETTYGVGESFTVSLVIDTGGKQINTISGVLDIPLDKTEFLDLRYGNSIVSLWVEQPTVDRQKGLISFSGGIPGGFSGSNGPLLSFSLRARREGQGKIFFKEAKVLLNDGQGTELTNLALPALTLTVNPAKPKPAIKEEAAEPEVLKEDLPPPDVTPPEKFIPLVSRHPDVADNKYFVSFFAVDKDTGISRYEIRERPRILTRITTKFDKGPVRVEQSPYILENQFWPTMVVVRAYDQAGNSTEGNAASSPSALFLALLIGAGGLVAAGAALVLLRVGYRQRWRHKV